MGDDAMDIDETYEERLAREAMEAREADATRALLNIGSGGREATAARVLSTLTSDASSWRRLMPPPPPFARVSRTLAARRPFPPESSSSSSGETWAAAEARRRRTAPSPVAPPRVVPDRAGELWRIGGRVDEDLSLVYWHPVEEFDPAVDADLRFWAELDDYWREAVGEIYRHWQLEPPATNQRGQFTFKTVIHLKVELYRNNAAPGRAADYVQRGGGSQWRTFSIPQVFGINMYQGQASSLEGLDFNPNRASGLYGPTRRVLDDLRRRVEEMYIGQGSADIFKIVAMGIMFTSFSRLRAGCDTNGRCKFNINGFALSSVKSRKNRCGLACIKAAARKLGVGMAHLPSSIVQVKRRICLLEDVKTPITPEAMVPYTDKLGVSLVVYHSDKLTDVEVGKLTLDDALFHNVDAKAPRPIVELVMLSQKWVDQDTLHESNVNHYVILNNGGSVLTTSVCERCGAGKGRTARHRCSRKCPDCGVIILISNKSHVCIVREQRAVQNLVPRSASELYEKRRVRISESLQGREETAVWETFHTALLSGRSICLGGDGGVGKTFMLNSCLKKLPFHPSQIAFLCHDALPAQNYRGWRAGGTFVGTLHSFLGMTPKTATLQHLKSKLQRERYLNTSKDTVSKRLSRIQLIVIDEVPTVGHEMFELLHQSLCCVRQVRRSQAMGEEEEVKDDRPIMTNDNTDASAEPFGGVQMILVGDFRQRPPVSTGLAAAGGGPVPIFMHPRWHMLDLNYMCLRTLRRISPSSSEEEMKHGRFQLACARGVVSSQDLAWYNSHQATEADLEDPSFTQIARTNAQCSEISLQVVRKAFPAESLVTYPPLHVQGGADAIQSWSNLKRGCEVGGLTVGVGVRVMLTRNMASSDVYNGSIGIVQSHNVGEIRVDFGEGRVVSIAPEPLYGKKYVHFPLRLAYGITVAKSQGLSLARVIIHTDSGRSRWTTGEMYVAVSRVQSIENVRVKGNIWNQDIVVNPICLDFADRIEDCTGSDTIPLTYLKDQLSYNLAQNNRMTTYNLNTSSATLSIYRGASGRKSRSKYMLSKVVCFDLETTQFASPVMEVYSVAASYIVNDTIQDHLQVGWEQVIRDHGTFNVFKHFIDWLFHIMEMDYDKYDRNRNQNGAKDPIMLVAFFGSGFDFSFLMRYLIHTNPDPRYHMEYIMRGSQIMRLSLFRLNAAGEKDKLSLVTWDPYLLLGPGYSLDKCAKAFELEGGGKAIFPHKYLNRVGPLEAFRSPGFTQIPCSDFNCSRARIEEFCRERQDTFGSQLRVEGTMVNFPLRDVHDHYLAIDVELLIGVTRKLNLMVYETLVKGKLAFDYISAAALTMAGFMHSLETRFRYNTHKQLKRKHGADTGLRRVNREEGRNIISQIHRLTLTEADHVRKSIYGGKSFPRALYFQSAAYDALVHKDATGTLTAQDYDECSDALFYLDVHAMYGSIMNTQQFPYGDHHVLELETDCQALLDQFVSAGEDATPMFIMRCDVVCNPHDLEPPLGERSSEGLLRWDNSHKKQQYYCSVDLATAIKRGCVVSRPTWCIVWGRQVNEEGGRVRWQRKSGLLLKAWTDVTSNLKQQGGPLGAMGKLMGNALYGTLLKRDFGTQHKIITNLREWVDMIRDPALNCVHVEGLVDCKTLITKFESVRLPDSQLSRNAAHLGSFVLAYSHRLIDQYTFDANPERCSGKEESIQHQPYCGDTDSIFMHMRSCASAAFLQHLGDRPGELGDDLEKLYKGDKTAGLDWSVCKTCTNGERCVHGVRFAKIVKMESPAPKVYALTVLLPDGSLVEVGPKTKGIPRENLYILSTEEFEEKEPLLAQPVPPSGQRSQPSADLNPQMVRVSRRQQQRARVRVLEREEVFKQQMTMSMLSTVRRDHEAKERGGDSSSDSASTPGLTILTPMNRMIRTMDRVRNWEVEQCGKQAFGLHFDFLKRNILSTRWSGRRMLDNKQWTVPLSWRRFGECHPLHDDAASVCKNAECHWHVNPDDDAAPLIDTESLHLDDYDIDNDEDFML